jgi:hypothetical protein
VRRVAGSGTGTQNRDVSYRHLTGVRWVRLARPASVSRSDIFFALPEILHILRWHPAGGNASRFLSGAL